MGQAEDVADRAMTFFYNRFLDELEKERFLMNFDKDIAIRVLERITGKHDRQGVQSTEKKN